MTRKDYQFIADALRRAKPGSHYNTSRLNEDTVKQWQTTCRLIAGSLAADNPRFNHSIFYAACDLIEEPFPFG